MKKHHALVLAAALALGNSLHAASPVTDWWDGKYATGNWFGARDTLEDHGIFLNGSWKANFFGIVDGGKKQRAAFDEQILFSLKLDFEKMAGITGLSAYASAWYRDGYNVNNYVGASPAFNPSAQQVGTKWRLLPVYAMWESRDLLPVKDMITIAGGWTNPYYFFIQQPSSQLFVNNAVFQTKGLVNNGIPWSGAADTWGGHLKIKTMEWHYVQVGMYVAIPGTLDANNHGLYFAGAQPPNLNGHYIIGETGVTPKIGESKLPGKYAFGGIYFGVENSSFLGGGKHDGRYSFYWQADQMLFREPSPEASLAKGSFKEAVPTKTKLSEQGLSFFSIFTFSPKYNNAMPFYFHTGLVYKGLIPTRDNDQLGISFAYGNYSYDKLVADNSASKAIQTYEANLELDYRLQLTKFAYIQPFFQYSIRPNGTGLVENATILGAQAGVTF